VRDIWFDWLRERRPDLLPRYRELYARGAYMQKDEASRLSALVRRPGRDGPRRGIRPSTQTGHERAEESPGQSSLF
jgi:hypothetical protein